MHVVHSPVFMHRHLYVCRPILYVFMVHVIKDKQNRVRSRVFCVMAHLQSAAPAIFVETTINPKQIREIARETGVKIGGELYSDSMGPEGSAGETYLGMMRENILLIVNALQ